MDLCQQSDVLAFSYAVKVCHSFPSKKQMSSNFMAEVTICSDFEAQENKVCTVSIASPSICHEMMELDAMIFIFWMLSFKAAFSFSSFTFKKPFSSSLLSPIRVVSSVYLRLLMFLPEILIPACASSSPAFHMMCSAYELNKQGGKMQPCHTLFPILNQSVVPCLVLTAGHCIWILLLKPYWWRHWGSEWLHSHTHTEVSLLYSNPNVLNSKAHILSIILSYESTMKVRSTHIFWW